MSSLRVETLRLCWLEAFIAVAEEENISEAANVLGIDQSTVSRYMQALEKWLGKTLIVPGGIVDHEDPRPSIAITEEGQAFYLVAQKTVEKLQQFRAEGARRQELVGEFSSMVSKLESDLNKPDRLDVTEKVRSNIEMFQRLVLEFQKEPPLELVEAYTRNLKAFSLNYQNERKREERFRKAVEKAGTSGRDIKISGEVVDTQAKIDARRLQTSGVITTHASHTCYYLRIHGRLKWNDGSLRPNNAEPRPLGFYCQRFVVAPGEKSARTLAFKMVRDNLDERKGWLSSGQAKLKLNLEEIYPVPEYEDSAPADNEYIYYLND